jgi:hypothetical protein
VWLVFFTFIVMLLRVFTNATSHSMQGVFYTGQRASTFGQIRLYSITFYRKASYGERKPKLLPPKPPESLSDTERAFATDPYGRF